MREENLLHKTFRCQSSVYTQPRQEILRIKRNSWIVLIACDPCYPYPCIWLSMTNLPPIVFLLLILEDNYFAIFTLLFNYSMYSSISHHWFSDVGTCSGSDEQHLVQDDLIVDISTFKPLSIDKPPRKNDVLA